ncbi:MAG: hypothetical protein ACOC22_03525 [bacterium]
MYKVYSLAIIYNGKMKFDVKEFETYDEAEECFTDAAFLYCKGNIDSEDYEIFMLNSRIEEIY